MALPYKTRRRLSLLILLVGLPLTLLIDSKGRVLQRFEGRLAPEVWDGVADLLP